LNDVENNKITNITAKKKRKRLKKQLATYKIKVTAKLNDKSKQTNKSPLNSAQTAYVHYIGNVDGDGFISSNYFQGVNYIMDFLHTLVVEVSTLGGPIVFKAPPMSKEITNVVKNCK